MRGLWNKECHSSRTKGSKVEREWKEKRDKARFMEIFVVGKVG